MPFVVDLGEKRRLFRCCGAIEPCTKSPHVYTVKEYGELLNKHTFYETTTAAQASIDGRQVLAMDCEMVQTTGGLEIGRISIVDEKEQVVVDVYVLPDHPVVDYNERWSGLNAQLLAEKSQGQHLHDVRPGLQQVIQKDTILVGHSLNGDLKCLRVCLFFFSSSTRRDAYLRFLLMTDNS